MKKVWLISAVLFQVALLAYLAGEREWVARTGRTVFLRTEPVDPRDVMRGDYVRLNYEVSTVPAALWQGTPSATNLLGRGRPVRVYAALRADEAGTAKVISLSDGKPSADLFLRGWGEPLWGSVWRVRYGIEAFFMEQGAAQRLEDQRSGERRNVPLNMEVAVGRNGLAVLKGYRWESLGINLAFDARRQTNQITGALAPGKVLLALTVELKNHAPEEVAIVNLPQNRSFALLHQPGWAEPDYRWVGEDLPVPAPRPEDVIVLKPGQSHLTRLDLTRSEWFVVDKNPSATNREPLPLGQLAAHGGGQFRIEYRPPPASECRTLPNARLIAPGRLRSPAFNPGARASF